MTTVFHRNKLRCGQWVHVRSYRPMGRIIRYALNAWESRLCVRLGVPPVQVWGNHDGLIITPDIPHIGPPYGVCEALASGNIITPLDDYERGTAEVRIFEPLEGGDGAMFAACVNWLAQVQGDGYDYTALIGLALRAWWGCDVDTSERNHFYCTEGAAKAYRTQQPGLDLLQDPHVAPHHVEQAAGLIPRPIGRRTSLREVTASVAVERHSSPFGSIAILSPPA